MMIVQQYDDDKDGTPLEMFKDIEYIIETE